MFREITTYVRRERKMRTFSPILAKSQSPKSLTESGVLENNRNLTLLVSVAASEKEKAKSLTTRRDGAQNGPAARVRNREHVIC